MAGNRHPHGRDLYPDVTLEHGLVDSAAMRLITHPKSYDVILTENMFGDILSDEASVLCGSIGLLGSASLGEPGKPGPVRTDPRLGARYRRPGQANPWGSLRAAAMLLRDSLDLPEAASALDAAIDAALDGAAATADLGGSLGCKAMAGGGRCAAGLRRGPLLLAFTAGRRKNCKSIPPPSGGRKLPPMTSASSCQGIPTRAFAKAAGMSGCPDVRRFCEART